MTMIRRAAIILSLAALGCASACGSRESPRAPESATNAAAASTPSAPPVAPAGSDPSSPDTASVVTAGASGIEVLPADRLGAVAATLANGSTTARSIFNHGSYWAVQARRVADGVPEVHDHWEDVAIVQAGRATLLAGGRVEGSRLQSPGEHRGGRIIGGTRHPIAAGDVVVVPVGVPHQYEVARGDSIRYLTVKAPPRTMPRPP